MPFEERFATLQCCSSLSLSVVHSIAQAKTSENAAEPRGGQLRRPDIFGRESSSRRHEVSRAYEPAGDMELQDRSLVGMKSLVNLLSGVAYWCDLSVNCCSTRGEENVLRFLNTAKSSC